MYPCRRAAAMKGVEIMTDTKFFVIVGVCRAVAWLMRLVDWLDKPAKGVEEYDEPTRGTSFGIPVAAASVVRPAEAGRDYAWEVWLLSNVPMLQIGG